MKKILIAALILLILLSCTKQKDYQSNELSFSIGNISYHYSNVIISAQPFCGQTWYSIEGIKDSSNIFLINIITDSLHSGIYEGNNNLGSNLYGNPISGYTTTITINLDKSKSNISANFFGTLNAGNRSYEITGGHLFINLN